MLTFPKLIVRINHHGINKRASIPGGRQVQDIHYYLQWSGRAEAPTNKNFVFLQEEFERAAREGGEYADIAHRCSIMGDLWTLYDLEFGGPAVGQMRGWYVRMDFPVDAVRAVARYLRIIASKMDGTWTAERDQSSRDVEITVAMRERWLKKYGQGKGQVKLVIEPETEQRLKLDIEQDEAAYAGTRREYRSMKDQFEGLLCIARNSTYNFRQVAELRVSKDMDSYYWVAITPKGGRIMNGGLIQHSKDPSKPSWSTHT